VCRARTSVIRIGLSGGQLLQCQLQVSLLLLVLLLLLLLKRITISSPPHRSCVSLFYTKSTVNAMLQVPFSDSSARQSASNCFCCFPLQIDKDYVDAYSKTPSLLINLVAAMLGLKTERVTATVRRVDGARSV
jgi:hypothetical protein